MTGHDRPLLSRRTFIGATLAVAAAGCAAPDDQVSSSSTSSTTSTTRPGQGLPITLVALFDASGGIVVSGIEQRLTWALGDGAGVLSADQPEQIDIGFELDGRRIGTVEGVRRDVGLQQGFIASTVVFPGPGLATATALVEEVDVTAEFNVVARDEIAVPGPGNRMPRVATPTMTEHLGVRPVCSRVPACPFHEISLADALGGSRPVALLIAAPGYCESTLCPPALELLIEAAPAAPHVTVVHAEVYVDPEAANALSVAELTPAARTYGLTFEPSLFLATSNGVVAGRLDNIFDADELADALADLR